MIYLSSGDQWLRRSLRPFRAEQGLCEVSQGDGRILNSENLGVPWVLGILVLGILYAFTLRGGLWRVKYER